MEIKIICNCGQKIAFDVEPVNGRMPVTLSCPVCGADGTAAANAVIAAKLNFPAPPPPPTGAPTSGGLRLNKPESAQVEEAPAAPAPYAAQAATRPKTYTPTPYTPKYLKDDPSLQNNNFGLGILGAFLGSILGCTIMFGLWYFVGFTIPYTGTAIGAMTGFGARLFYKGTDFTLGVASAIIACVIVGGSLYAMFGMYLLFNIGCIFSFIFAIIFAWKIASG